MVLFYAGNLAEPLAFGHILVISGRSTPDAQRYEFYDDHMHIPTIYMYI